jgi:hypothetical protein
MKSPDWALLVWQAQVRTVLAARSRADVSYVTARLAG